MTPHAENLLRAEVASLRDKLTGLSAEYAELLAVVGADDALAEAHAQVRYYRALASALKSQLDACMDDKNGLIRQVKFYKKREANR